MQLTVMADWNADPLRTKQGVVDLETLPVSPRLTAELLEWARQWEHLHDRVERAEGPDSYTAWVSSGRRLSRDLQVELGPGYEIEYAHDHEG